MRHPLESHVEALRAHNDTLGKARNAYLAKEAERKHFEATLIRAAEGKSHAEKTVNAQATLEWVEFQVALARLEAVFEFQKLKYDVLDKEYQAAYLQLKLDGPLIRKQGA
jgi:hypothetical protein